MYWLIVFWDELHSIDLQIVNYYLVFRVFIAKVISLSFYYTLAFHFINPIKTKNYE